MKAFILVTMAVLMMVSFSWAELTDGDFSGKGWAQTKEPQLWPHENDGMLDAGWCVMSTESGWTYNTSAKRAETKTENVRGLGQIFTTKLEKGNSFKFDYEVKDGAGEDSGLIVIVVGSKGEGSFDFPDCLTLHGSVPPKGKNYTHTVLFNKSVVTGSGKGTASIDLSQHDLKSFTYIQLVIVPKGFAGGYVYISNARFTTEKPQPPASQ